MTLPEAEGEKLGELSIDLSETTVTDDVMNYQVEADVEGDEIVFDLPRYHTHLGWIEIFGIPPFNEWVVLDDFNQLEKAYSGEINGEEYSEEIEVDRRDPSETVIHLHREISGKTEDYTTREIDQIEGGTRGNRAVTEVEHSDGTCHIDTERNIAQSESEIKKLKEELETEERDYIEKVMEEEGEPDIVVLKTSTVDGIMPPVYRELFPFWDSHQFKDSSIRSIEIGYMDRGDSEEEIDMLHGRWYKLFSLEDFDYDLLEIREGNWKSTEVKFQEEKVITKEHYEKHLYSYS